MSTSHAQTPPSLLKFGLTRQPQTAILCYTSKTSHTVLTQQAQTPCPTHHPQTHCPTQQNQSPCPPQQTRKLCPTQQTSSLCPTQQTPAPLAQQRQQNCAMTVQRRNSKLCYAQASDFIELMVPGDGFEPPTRGFSIRCSTD